MCWIIMKKSSLPKNITSAIVCYFRLTHFSGWETGISRRVLSLQNMVWMVKQYAIHFHFQMFFHQNLVERFKKVQYNIVHRFCFPFLILDESRKTVAMALLANMIAFAFLDTRSP